MIKKYFSLVKFSHTIFALPFAIIGFFMGWKAGGQLIDWMLFIKVMLCMVFARTAAMAFNRWADREIDSKNVRTAIREIPSGSISSEAAIWLVVFSGALFILTTYFINSLCFYLSPVALLVVLGYSYTKRFTALCHFVLGLGLSLAPIGAYISVTGEFAILPILFSALVLFWVSGFDIVYSLQDEEFDKSNDLHSVPSIIGKPRALKLSRILHFICVFIIAFIIYIGNFSWPFLVGGFGFSSLLLYQHSLVKHNDLSKVNLAFFTTNGIASVFFALFFILDMFITSN